MAATSSTGYHHAHRTWPSALAEIPQALREKVISDKISSVSKSLEETSVTQEHVCVIAQFYLNIKFENLYIKKTDSNKLFFSVVFIGSNDFRVTKLRVKPGLYLQLKSKHPKNPIGVGSSNKATLLFHWETELMHTQRSCETKNIGIHEIHLNTQLSPYPDYFVTGAFFEYRSTCSPREWSPDEVKTVKAWCPSPLVSKTGFIADYYPNGNLSTFRRMHLKFFTHYNTVITLLHLAKGIAIIHQLGFVHLDIKPNNILIDSRCLPKIIDFGMSKRIYDQCPRGAPGYASPQRCLAEKDKTIHLCSPPDDVWSYGAVAAILFNLSKWVSWCNSNHKSLITKKEQVEETATQIFCDETFSHNLLKKCFGFDPEQRITFSDIIKILDKEANMLLDKTP